MNAVEIEEAVSTLAEAPFDGVEFPFAFLEAFGNKETTLKRLRTGNTNQSDVDGVLQRNNIHLKVAPPGQVAETLTELRDSPATAKQKAKFILATDGVDLFAEQLAGGGGGDVPPLVCTFKDLPNHFAFFLPLAGITTVRAIAENAFDIRATGRLNRLYVELLKHNPDWDSADRREDLNHFFARLIFCFFAEDTGIFDGTRLFTGTIEQMTERDGSNTHEVLSKLFEAMNTPREKRAESVLPPSALKFPYVNGNLFAPPRRVGFIPTAGAVNSNGGDEPHPTKLAYDVPKFSKIARSYLLFVGGLDWKLINPDIFGSMIQAVADDEERGALGMHYTSVPNILKVLNPLFLDDLRQKLAEAGDGSTPASKGQLKRLRDRMARIRVFDPACGSGNFLVIAYKEMRQIEAVINERRNERELPSVIPSTNFRGIEIRHFAAEIARLALIIARFQCDALHISHLFARNQVLPLDKDNWITCGNALRLDWLDIMDVDGTGVRVAGDDLFNTPLDQVEMSFENSAGETYLCGNPPYQGSVNQTSDQKDDMARVFADVFKKYKDLDYVAAFMLQAARFNRKSGSRSAFVATNSITQGEQVAMLWPLIFSQNNSICFAHRSFMWSNLASHKAAVTCVIIGLVAGRMQKALLFGEDSVHEVDKIGPYLVRGADQIIEKRSDPIHAMSKMDYGNKPTDGGNLILSYEEALQLVDEYPQARPLIREYWGAHEFVASVPRYCLWITTDFLGVASSIPEIRERIARVRELRAESRGQQANSNAKTPHRFVYCPHTDDTSILIPQHVSANRKYFTVGLARGKHQVIANSASAIYNGTLVDFAVLSSSLHIAWIDAVAGRIKTDYRYSSTLVWNTFPVPALSESSKAELTRRAEEILLAREAHFPATIADLYDPDNMPPDLRAAHDRNDETLERIYIGRRFKNDTERLEKLFELYTQMTAKQLTTTPSKRKKKGV